MLNWWSSIETVSLLNTTFQWAIVLVSVLILVFSTRLSTLQDLESSRNKEAFKLQISKAKEIADLAHDKLKPRLINEEQKERFSAISKNLPKGLVRITSITANSESLGFGSQLANMLKESGYTVNEEQILFVDAVPVGLQMYNGVESKVGSYSIALKDCLEKIGFETKPGTPMEKGQEFPEIIIGEKN